ncbi:MAG: PHP domain-containing protein [Saccharofermentanales bacterium]
MRRELHYFDIYPKTVLNGADAHITVQALGSHAGFTAGRSYKITFIPMCMTIEGTGRSEYCSIVAAAAGNSLEFDYSFTGEQEYAIRITMDDEGRFILLPIYCLDKDLYEMVPLKGDLHVHTCFSDGAEKPERVTANYRRAGYDFLVISDHWNYEGSVAARKFYEDVPVDIAIVNGEEVHAPGNHVHIVNFGGESSVNALFAADEPSYQEEVAAISAGLQIPEEAGGVSRFAYASCLWVSNEIRKAKGLSILAHPFWIVDAYHINPDMTRHLLKNGVFDALELVGGLSPRENMMQLAFYHTESASGSTDIPIVGSSDSHGTVIEPFAGSWFSNPVDNEHGYFEFFSIVFAPANNKDAIIGAIKQGYSVAVDHYRNETPRVYGDYRMVSYAIFLLSEYFPLHEEICFEEGRAMQQYASVKDPDALALLGMLHGRIRRFWKKYFGHDER